MQKWEVNMKNEIHIRAHELSKVIREAQKELDELKKKCKNENFQCRNRDVRQ